ncbi:MAG: O-antigen ligase family protein [Candidatus Vogelbacteria bacterium]|nr:O-antigen ligase family protein [Candidatus Vogelbacteria bacterium]
MRRILSGIVLGGIFAVSFVPVIVTPFLAMPFVTGKAFVFRILVELTAGAWLGLILIAPQYRPKLTQLKLAGATFLVLIALSNLLGVNPDLSFWGNFGRMEGWIMLAHLFFYFVIAGSVLRGRRMWSNFFLAFILGSSLVVLVALGQLARIIPVYRDIAENRLDGTFGNAGFLASYLVPLVFLALTEFWRKRNSWMAWSFYGLMTSLYLIVIYFTATRSALIALVIGIFTVATLISIKERRTVWRRSAIVAIGIIVILVVGIIISRNNPLTKANVTLERLSNASWENFKHQNRYYLWQMAWAGFKERPILGWGQENYYSVFHKYYLPAYDDSQETYSDRAHNIVLDWLVAGGIIGLIFYLSIYTIAFWLLWRPTKAFPNSERYLMTGLLTASFVNNLLTFDSLATYLIFFVVLAFIDSGNENKPTMGIKFPSWIIGPVVLLTLILAYLLNAKAIVAAQSFATGIKSLPNNPEKSYQAFGRALNQNGFGVPEIRRQLAVIVLEPERLAQAKASLKRDFYNLAIGEMAKQMTESPNDPQVFYLAGLLWHSQEKKATALKLLEQARILSPHRQATLIKLGGVYLETNQIDKLADILRQRLADNPQDFQLSASLAAAHLKLGQRDEAIKVLRQAAELNHEFNLWSKGWIEQIERGEDPSN